MHDLYWKFKRNEKFQGLGQIHNIPYASAGYNVSIYAFTIKKWWNFAMRQIIFKAITGSFAHAFWWETIALQSMEMLLDTCLVALESIPEKVLRYAKVLYTLPSKENFPRQRPAPWFLWQIFLLPVQCRTFLLPRGMTGTSCYHFENSITPR